MRATSSKHIGRSERGSSLLMFTLMTWLVVLPMIGLAIDGSIVFFAQQRLSASVDAAALAGGRAFTADTTVSSQGDAINSTVSRYFNANFPVGFLGTKNVSLPAPEIIDNQVTRVRTIKVTAGADVALYFMPILGYGVTHISAAAQTSRRDINIVLVLDRSGSMDKACAPMKTSAQNFVDGFSNGNDTLGAVTFVSTGAASFVSGKDFKTRTPKNLSQTLGGITCNGSTNSSEALMIAWNQLKANSKPGTLDVILFFTDGYPHGFTSNIKLKSGSACVAPAQGAPGYISGDPTSVTAALTSGNSPFQRVDRAVNLGDPPTLTLSGCTLNSMTAMNNNFEGYPLQDFYGNTTDTYKSATINNSTSYVFYTLSAKNAAGKYGFSVGNAWLISKSTAYNAAKTIRQAGVKIYTIGLQSHGVDEALLRQMANDLSSDEYNPSEPQGRYAPAADDGQIAAAFNSIKSELLRLSQ